MGCIPIFSKVFILLLSKGDLKAAIHCWSMLEAHLLMS